MIQITGRSYRLRRQQSELTQEKEDGESDPRTAPPASKTGQSAPRVDPSKTGQGAPRVEPAAAEPAVKKRPSRGK
jgi:hypothetical protein